MSGRTGKRSKRPKPCARCGLKIDGVFNRERHGDYHLECWVANCTTPELIPPDLDRCQSEIREGSFMTLGPRSYERCKNTPAFIAIETKAGKDGQRGSMSLCPECKAVCEKELGHAVEFKSITK